MQDSGWRGRGGGGGPGTAAGVAVAGLVLLAFGPQSGHARIVTPYNGMSNGGCWEGGRCRPCPGCDLGSDPCFGSQCGSCCGGLSGYSCDISDDDGVLQSCNETTPGSGSDALTFMGLYGRAQFPIRGIRPGAFVGLSRLRLLVLEHNAGFWTIVNGTFDGLYGLVSLVLANNALRNIEPGAFRGSRLGGYCGPPGNRTCHPIIDDYTGQRVPTRVYLDSNPLTMFPCEGFHIYGGGSVLFPVGFNHSTDCCSVCTYSPTMSPTTLAPTRPPTTSAPTPAPTMSPTTLAPTRAPTPFPTHHESSQSPSIPIVASIAGGVVMFAGVLWMVFRKKRTAATAYMSHNDDDDDMVALAPIAAFPASPAPQFDPTTGMFIE